MGRKKKPTKLKVIEGTFRKDRSSESEPFPDVCIPLPPDHLTDTAKKEWERISRELYSLGLLSEIDMAALAGYCQVYGRWADAEAQLKEGSILVKTNSGNIIQSPLVGIANTALKLMHKLLAEFGMTPASRAKVVSNKQEKGVESKWAKK